MEITVPYKFEPRDYQLPVFEAMDSGYKFAILLWHRRSGKDKTLLNLLVKKTQERKGVYYYFFPTYKQGRKVIWDGIDRDEFKFMDHFPKEIIAKRNDHEMKLELTNGSVFQVVGCDDYDKIMGSNPVGCIFSEYPLQNPKAWEYLSPILAENDGWAVFAYTPRGKNHGHSLWKFANKRKNWWTQKLTVEDTNAIKKEKLEEDREMKFDQTGNDSLYLQEYFVSFDVSIEGSYYGKQMLDADRGGRIIDVPWIKSLEVDTWWDIGMHDSTAIWFTQTLGTEIHFIDYYEAHGEGLQHYADVLRTKPYMYGYHTGPWDLQVRELGSGTSRLQTARKLGINFTVLKQSAFQDGIEASRAIFPRCWFDKTKCERGIDCLNSYCKEFDDDRQEYKNKPKTPNWPNHGSDAFRYMAVGHNMKRPDLARKRKKTKTYSKTNTVSGY